MLEISSIDVYYGKMQAIKEVSLDVKQGELVCVIGPNGAGKTTIMHAICGITPPKKGSIRFLGQRIDHLAPSKIARKGITIVFQGRRLFNDQSVIDNLRLPVYARSKHGNYAEDLEVVFTTFPVLRGRESQIAGTLSGGEQQMLAIGRGMMARPKLMILDEPSFGLAPLLVDAIFDKVRELNSAGFTILLVEQVVWKAFEVASRGYVLNLGEFIADGNIEKLRQNPHIKTAYLSA